MEVTGTNEAASQAANEAGWVTGDGTINIANAPEEIRSTLEAKKFSDVSSVVQSYTELEKTLGSKLHIPDEIDNDARDLILSKLGRPDTADDYQLPDNLDIPQEILTNFAQYSHKLGLTQEQMLGAINFELEEGAKLAEKQMAESEKLLQEKYGSKKEAAIQKANQVATKLGLQELLVSVGLDKNAEVVIALSEAEKLFSEDKILENKNRSSTGQERLRELSANPALFNKMHPEHSIIEQEFTELSQQYKL